MRNNFEKKCRKIKGLTLAEILAALIIGCMVLITVLAVYNRADSSANAVNRKIDEYRMPNEILQRIAEDIDRMTLGGADVKIKINNKLDGGYTLYLMEIIKTIPSQTDEPNTYEEIIWQSDYDRLTNRLILYRSHGGMVLEDKLLDASKQSQGHENYFIPICEGITFFQIYVPDYTENHYTWPYDSLPHGVAVDISFAEPEQTPERTYTVPEEERITRTIAVNRIDDVLIEIPEVKQEKISDFNQPDANDVGDNIQADANDNEDKEN